MTRETLPRLLFVMDNDFGALGTVAYLMHRQPLAAGSTLLLPRRAHELHDGRLPIASRPYQSLQDILDFVEADSPDVVFLYSGYLLTQQRLLTIRALRRLIRALRQRGCAVATSDPYLGTFRRIADADVPSGTGFMHRFLHAIRVARHIRKVADILADVTHVYPVAADTMESGGPVKRISFFNPLYIRSPEELRENSAAVSALSDEPSGVRCWLFVLAQFDLEFQEKKHGRQGFADIVAGKIREALDSGRHAAFIGPASLTQALAARFAGNPGVTLLPLCSFEEFEQRLLDAEIVFLWHISSTSAFLRLWNGLPVFFFDQGHVPRILRPLHEAGLKHYYMGAVPVVLDIEKPLDASRLTELSAGFRTSAREACNRLARLPSPAEMVSAILGAA
jgi:hypothetical protein